MNFDMYRVHYKVLEEDKVVCRLSIGDKHSPFIERGEIWLTKAEFASLKPWLKFYVAFEEDS